MYNIDHATPELFAALALAQNEIENATKNANNPHYGKKYADLAEVLNTARPALSKNDVSLIQSPAFDGVMAHVTTILAHKSGGYITMTSSCVPAKSDAQGIGSATTYLRRYGASAAAGIAQEDDDGETTAHNRKPAPVTKITPNAGFWEAQNEESQAFLLGIAREVTARMADPIDATDYLQSQNLDSDEKNALWTRFDSKTRTALKKAHESRKAA